MFNHSLFANYSSSNSFSLDFRLSSVVIILLIRIKKRSSSSSFESSSLIIVFRIELVIHSNSFHYSPIHSDFTSISSDFILVFVVPSFHFILNLFGFVLIRIEFFMLFSPFSSDLSNFIDHSKCVLFFFMSRIIRIFITSISLFFSLSVDSDACNS